MENNKFLILGKNFYEWYRSNKVQFTAKDPAQELEREINQIAELIDYVKEKSRKM